MRIRIARSVGPKRLRVDGIAAATGSISRTVVITGTSSLTAVFDLSGVIVRSATIAGASTLSAAATRTIPRSAAIAAQSSLIATSGFAAVAPNLSALTVDNDAGTISFDLTPAAQVYWMVVTTDTADPTAEAIQTGIQGASGNFAAVDGANDITVENVFAQDVDDTFKIALVARVAPGAAWSLVRVANVVVDTTDPDPTSWSIADNGDNTFTINYAPTTPAALTATDNGNNTFTLTE
jgi:hypothetical protein